MPKFQMHTCPMCRRKEVVQQLQETVVEDIVRLSCPVHGLMDAYCVVPAQNVLAAEYYHLKVQA
jgi:hypothetical protein